MVFSNGDTAHSRVWKKAEISRAWGGCSFEKQWLRTLPVFITSEMTASCIRLQATDRTKCMLDAEITIQFFSTTFLTTKRFQWCNRKLSVITH